MYALCMKAWQLKASFSRLKKKIHDASTDLSVLGEVKLMGGSFKAELCQSLELSVHCLSV